MSCCFLTQPTGPPGTGGTPMKSFAFMFLRRLTLAVVFFFVILMVIFGIAWLVLHPHAPTFSVTSLSVSNFTLSDSADSQLSSKYDIEVAIKNPNKKVQVLLDHLMVFVLYDDEVELAKVGVEYSIMVEKMGENNFKLSVESAVKKKKIVKEVGEEWRRNGLVKMKVKILGRVRYSAGKYYWLTKQELLKVNCEDLNVQFLNNNNSTSGKLIPGFGKDCLVSSLQ